MVKCIYYFCVSFADAVVCSNVHVMFRDGVTVMTVDYYSIWMKLLYDVIQFACICRICFETKGTRMSINFLLFLMFLFTAYGMFIADFQGCANSKRNGFHSFVVKYTWFTLSQQTCEVIGPISSYDKNDSVKVRSGILKMSYISNKYHVTLDQIRHYFLNICCICKIWMQSFPIWTWKWKGLIKWQILCKLNLWRKP